MYKCCVSPLNLPSPFCIFIHSLSLKLHRFSLHQRFCSMKRDCNLELRLPTPSVSVDQNDKQLTIFYNGRVAVCDATELQARAIIWLASYEIKEKSNHSPGSGSDLTLQLPSPSLYSPTPSISMKRSLKRFLQKRQNRAQATSPYPIITRQSNQS